MLGGSVVWEPSGSGDPEPTILFRDPFTPDKTLSNNDEPEIGAAYTSPFGGSVGNFAYDSEALIFNISGGDILASALAAAVPSGGYRWVFEVGLSSPVNFIFGLDVATASGYAVYRDANNWGVSKLVNGVVAESYAGGTEFIDPLTQIVVTPDQGFKVHFGEGAFEVADVTDTDFLNNAAFGMEIQNGGESGRIIGPLVATTDKNLEA